MKLSEANNRSLLAILLWGIFGGICSAMSYYLLVEIWNQLLPSGAGFSQIHDAQIIILFVLVFALLGFFAGNLFSREEKSWEIIIGIGSGTGTALVFAVIVMIPRITAGSLDFFDSLVLLMEILLASVIIQTIAVYFHEPRREIVRDDTKIPYKPGITGQPHVGRILFFAVFAILSILIIPPVLLHVGNPVPVAEETSCCGTAITDKVDASRTGPDSIHIVMQPDSAIKHNSVPTVNIYLDEKDVSNQSIIKGSGLDAVISPSEGLVFERKASVTLQGKAVFGNTTDPVHLQIIVTYPDTGRRQMICDMQI